jgi:bacillithiol synthase
MPDLAVPVAMQLEKISLPDTHAFSSFFLDYIQANDSLKTFYNRPPQIESFRAQLQEKSPFSIDHRKVLVACLKRQYKNISQTDSVKFNIESLTSPKTFTVTTGHQLNIFTGPLYVIYKIVTTINICRQLREQYPTYSFVPVYWMASEDHDFEEISYFRLYGKKYKWQATQTGAVGRFDPKSIESLLAEIPGNTNIFRDAYIKNSTLSGAVRYYVDALFGSDGLVVLDADEPALKALFTKVMEEDLFQHTTRQLVEDQDAKLKTRGYVAQVHPRDVNFFYLDSGTRNRIERTKEGFSVVDSKFHFSDEEMRELIRSHPENLSPNVILRPLYQEIILPNLAYIGGPAEVVYWLQLKGVFEHFGVTFPILFPRNFAMVMDFPTLRKLRKLGLDVKDLFEEKNYIFNHWILKNTQQDLTLSDSIGSTREVFESIKAKINALDPTLGPMVGAEEKRALNSLEKIEHKILKSEKRRHAEKLSQIESVKETLFPTGSLQERSDNFLNFYQQDPQFIQKLLTHFDPFDFQFNILSYLD